MKKMMIGILVYMLLLGLCACGKSDADTGKDASKSSTQTIRDGVIVSATVPPKGWEQKASTDSPGLCYINSDDEYAEINITLQAAGSVEDAISNVILAQGDDDYEEGTDTFGNLEYSWCDPGVGGRAYFSLSGDWIISVSCTSYVDFESDALRDILSSITVIE